MSYDFDTIAGACDHLQVHDRMAISELDLRTLVVAAAPTERMRAPVNGRDTVVLKMAGKVIPKNHEHFGWVLEDDDWSVPPDKKLKVVFNRPLRRTGVLIELSYVTRREYCSKCGGSGVVSDFKMSGSGSLIPVLNRRKLVQRCLKFVLTSKCTFYPLLTCQVREYVGRKFGVTLTQDDIAYEITTALGALKQVQSYQARVQNLTPAELLKDIVGVRATTSNSDPSVVGVGVQVSSYKGTSATVSFGLRVRS